MARVIIQPTGTGSPSLAHGKISQYKSTLGSRIYSELLAAHPSGTAWFWGTTPGLALSNYKQWAKIQPGDLVLFTSKGKFIARAFVGSKFKSKQFSKYVFDGDLEPGKTWEYVYSLRDKEDIEDLNWSYARVNKWLGYSSNYTFRQLNCLDDRRSQIILSKSEIKLPPSPRAIKSERDAERLISAIKGDLSAPTVAMRRKEQSILKRYLLNGSNYGECLLCGGYFHEDALVAAHLKGRDKCTQKEMRNFRGIVMLNCKLGCDYLYGAGYIAISSKHTVFLSPKLTAALGKSAAVKLKGRKVPVTVEQEPFFEWHREHDLKR